MFRGFWFFYWILSSSRVLDLAILEATTRLVAFDVLSLFILKLERISFGISSDCEFITAPCIARAEFLRLGIDNCSYCNCFFWRRFQPINVVSDFSNFVASRSWKISQWHFKVWFDMKRWILALLSLSVLLYSWCRIVLTWITSFPLSFWCDLIALFAVSIFQSGTKYFLIWSVCKGLPFVFFVPFPLVFFFFICYFWAFFRFSLFVLFFFSFILVFFVFLSPSFFFSAFVKAFSSFGLPISLPLLPLFSFEEVNCSVASLCLQTCGNWCEPSWLPIQKSEPSCNHIEILKSFFLLSAFYLSHQNFWNWPTV